LTAIITVQDAQKPQKTPQKPSLSAVAALDLHVQPFCMISSRLSFLLNHYVEECHSDTHIRPCARRLALVWNESLGGARSIAVTATPLVCFKVFCPTRCECKDLRSSSLFIFLASCCLTMLFDNVVSPAKG
jgi:hypothetical protein